VMVAVRVTDGTYSMWIIVKWFIIGGTFLANQPTSLSNRSTSIPRVVSKSKRDFIFSETLEPGKGELYF